MTSDKLTDSQTVERQQVRRNVEENLNGMCWDDWVEYAERMDLSRKRILMGAQTKYRELYMEELED